MANVEESEVIEYPTTPDTLWSSIQTFETHQSRCPFCDNPQLVGLLAVYIRQSIPFDEMANRLQISEKKIRSHIEEVLNISSLEMASSIALLKIISKIGDTKVLDNVKAGDIIRAIQTLSNFKTMRKTSNNFNINSEKFGKMSSLELVKRNTE